MASGAVEVEHGRNGGAAFVQLGVVGRTAVSWGLAGGLLGALVVAGHMFAGSLSSSVGFLTATVAFLMGSAVGLFHGGLLGWAGRTRGVRALVGLRRLVLGLVVAVPVLVAGWAVAVVMTLSAAAYLSGRYLTLLVTLAGWVAALGAFVWAGSEARLAWRGVRERWPVARSVPVVVGLATLGLVPVFLVLRPDIWVLHVEPTSTAAVLMALGAGVWIVGPVAAVALVGIGGRRRVSPAAPGGPPRG